MLAILFGTFLSGGARSISRLSRASYHLRGRRFPQWDTSRQRLGDQRDGGQRGCSSAEVPGLPASLGLRPARHRGTLCRRLGLARPQMRRLMRRPARGPAGRRPRLRTGTVAAGVLCTRSSHWRQCQPAGPGRARAPSLTARTHAARTRASTHVARTRTRTQTGAGIQGCLGPRAMAMCVLCAHGSSTVARTTRAHAGPHDAEATRPDAARYHAVDGRHANPVCTRNWVMQRTAFNAHKAGSVEE